MRRRVLYVTGTRADFGLFRRTLEKAASSHVLDLSLCVTGMHLSPQYGYTIREVEASNLKIAGTVPVDVSFATGPAMARAIGTQVLGMTELFERVQPHMVVVLGDRGEMLSAVIAAVHLNIVVVHIHGGERSGTVDDSVRHAISKMAHFHLTATEGAGSFLRCIGEPADRIFVTGAPGLDGLLEDASIERETLFRKLGLDPHHRTALVVFHPVVQQESQAGEQAAAIAKAVNNASLQALWLSPNSDAGGDRIRLQLKRLGLGSSIVTPSLSKPPGFVFADNLNRAEYVSLLATVEVMVGNSSSGIIEAPTFGTPVVNIGDRQHGRERSRNIIDTAADHESILAAIQRALVVGKQVGTNQWGDGGAGARIVKLLESLPLDSSALEKFHEG
jgi:GDP/UDP-N,N'-diacetylbacillosamine 2-epimerase (hydrolysing)